MATFLEPHHLALGSNKCYQVIDLNEEERFAHPRFKCKRIASTQVIATSYGLLLPILGGGNQLT